MRIALAALFCILSLETGTAAEQATKPPTLKPIRVAAICFFKYEQSSGLNKICFYDCLGSPAAITVSSIEICPLSINR